LTKEYRMKSDIFTSLSFTSYIQPLECAFRNQHLNPIIFELLI
jgi:hypothetical protein